MLMTDRIQKLIYEFATKFTIDKKIFFLIIEEEININHQIKKLNKFGL